MTKITAEQAEQIMANSAMIADCDDCGKTFLRALDEEPLKEEDRIIWGENDKLHPVLCGTCFSKHIAALSKEMDEG